MDLPTNRFVAKLIVCPTSNSISKFLHHNKNEACDIINKKQANYINNSYLKVAADMEIRVTCNTILLEYL